MRLGWLNGQAIVPGASGLLVGVLVVVALAAGEEGEDGALAEAAAAVEASRDAIELEMALLDQTAEDAGHRQVLFERWGEENAARLERQHELELELGALVEAEAAALPEDATPEERAEAFLAENHRRIFAGVSSPTEARAAQAEFARWSEREDIVALREALSDGLAEAAETLWRTAAAPELPAADPATPEEVLRAAEILVERRYREIVLANPAKTPGEVQALAGASEPYVDEVREAAGTEAWEADRARLAERVAALRARLGQLDE